MAGLEHWIEAQYHRSREAMLPAVSAVNITKQRPGFGQTIVPRRGSIVASPVLAAYDPDPDYFFHWFRDSSVVMDAVRLLLARWSNCSLLCCRSCVAPPAILITRQHSII